MFSFLFFFCNNTATTEIYTLSLHDALPIWRGARLRRTFHRRGDAGHRLRPAGDGAGRCGAGAAAGRARPDRKSTRLNSSHVSISYAVFCLKKKKTTKNNIGTLYKRNTKTET